MLHLDGNAQLASLVGGAAAALTSSCIGTPVDVIAQRQMLQNKQHNLTNRHYTGMWSTCHRAIKNVLSSLLPQFYVIVTELLVLVDVTCPN